MDIEMYKPFKLIFSMFKFVGIWQDGNQSWIYFILGYLVHILSNDIFISCEILYLVNSVDLMDFVHAFVIMVTYSALACKTKNFFWKIKKINASVETLNDLLNITQNYDLFSHVLIRKQVAFSYKIYLMLWSSALVTCTAGAFVPFINHKLPYKVWFPFETDIEKNELGFWVASFLVVFNSFFGSAIDMALDILPVTFMAFAIGLLNELSERIKKVRTYDDLVQCVVIHRKIKLFVNEIYENFATAIFIQGIMSSLILCTGVFTMSVTKSTADFIQITTFIIPMVLEIFLPCYFGNELSIASSELTSSMFQSKWIEGDSKLKKTLMIFMECNRKELRLTALGWFEINIPTFTVIGRSAYSFFNLMKQMQ